MLTFIATCFYKVLFGESNPKIPSQFICRDELSKKKAAPATKHGDSFSSRKPLVKVKESKMRIKVKMTREEAARLLSRCKDGGILEFKDVASELVKLPMNRVTVVSYGPADSNSLLDRIPEEC